jgi:hypothetical protein
MMRFALTKFRTAFLCLMIAVILHACQSRDIETDIPETELPEEMVAIEEEVTDTSLDDWEIEFRQQRFLGDLLFDALNALADDRLLTPIDDNAHSRYQRVLAYEPDNKLALEGLQNIVMRYLALASEASRQGRFASAQTLLDRARFVDEENSAINQAQLELEAEMNSGDLVFELNPQDLVAQSDELQVQLADIAAQAREHDAFLLITAPNDEQARWVYGVMRESVTGYRIRSNIELGSYAIIRLRMPDIEPGDGSAAPAGNAN